MTFSFGTTTWWNRVTLFSRPRRPEEGVAPLDGDARAVGLDHERGDATAGARRERRYPRHHHQQGGERAVGRPELDPVEQVVAVGVGWRRGRSRAGSEPSSGSVSRNAEISPPASRGRKRSFCSSVPKSLSGCGTPIDWCAESSAATAGLAEPTSIRARQ